MSNSFPGPNFAGLHLVVGQKGDDRLRQPSSGTVVEEVRPRLKKPPKYQVVMLNDDFTPMEFVVVILEKFFGMERELAVRVMLKVHTEGQAVCGVYTKDIAETNASQVNQYARDNEHPLKCEIQPMDDDDDGSN